MASFPTSTATKPSGIIDGATIFALHVAPLWDEVIVLENILRGVSNQSIGSIAIQGSVGQATNLFTVGTSASATDRFVLNAAGKLALPVQGSTGGIVLGGDASLYRGTGGVLESAQQLSLTTTGTGGGVRIGGDVNLYRSSTEAVIETNYPLSFKTLPLGASTDVAFRTRVEGDTNNRFAIQADGRLSWGSGAGSADATVSRSGAGALNIAASVSVTGSIAATGSITSNSLAVVTTNDSRLTDSRIPTGSAGGDLAGTYPSPTLVSSTFTSTPGVYKSVTVNAKGLVTAGSNPTTLAGYGIIDAQPIDSTGILASIPSLVGNGIIIKTGTGTTTTTSIATASTSRITVSNASGVLGSPTIDLASNVIASPGTFTSVTIDTYGRVTAGTNPTYVTSVTGPVARVAVSTTVTGPTGAGAVVVDLPTGVATAGTYNTVTIDTYGRTTAGSTAQTVSSVTGPSRLSFSVTGPTGANAVAVDLGTVGTAGTYNTVTTDAYGRVSAGSVTLSVASVTGPSGQLAFSVTGPTGTNAVTVGLAAAGSAGTYNTVTTDTYGRVTVGSTVQTVTSVTGPSGQLAFGVSGPTGTNTVTVGLATTGTAGTYNTVTTDAYGRVTAGSTAQTVTSVTGPSRLVFSVSGPTGANAVNVDLNSAGTPGAYTLVTTDSYGRVIAGSNPTFVGYVTGPSTNRLSFSSAASSTGPTGTTAITLDLASFGTAGTQYTAVTTDAYGRVSAGFYPTFVGYVTGPTGPLTFSSTTSSTGPTGTTAVSISLADGSVSYDKLASSAKTYSVTSSGASNVAGVYYVTSGDFTSASLSSAASQQPFVIGNHTNTTTPIVLSLPTGLGAVGDSITVCQYGVGTVTIAPKSGSAATINGSTSTTYNLINQYSVVILICVLSNTWVIMGDYN